MWLSTLSAWSYTPIKNNPPASMALHKCMAEADVLQHRSSFAAALQNQADNLSTRTPDMGWYVCPLQRASKYALVGKKIEM